MQVDIKKLRPIGVIIVLLIGVLTIAIYLTADFGVPPRYEPLHDTEYYQESREHMEELLIELRENVIPGMPAIVGFEVAEDGKTIVLQVTQGEYDKVRVVLERDFGEGLFSYILTKGWLD